MLAYLKKALAGAFSVRRDELRRVLPLASAYGLVLASLYLLKPARNALFLDSMGIGQLPYVLLLVALVGGLTASVFGKFSASLPIDKLIQRTYLALIVMLLGFRLILNTGWNWVYYAFYIWVALYGLLTTSLLWLLANAVFTSREARRVFSFIGTGGIAGAIVGGVFTGWASHIVGTENLLVVCAGFLAVCIFLTRLVRPGEQNLKRRDKAEAEKLNGLSAIRSSKLLTNLTLATGLIAIVAVVVDIQFNELVDRAFESKDEKTAFFGSFFAYLSGFSFIFQLVLTPVILRVLGVGIATMILPATMGLGSLAVLFVPGLMAGVLAKSADGGFRHSVHKAASEVLFLPVPAHIKKQSKLFLDTTVDTLATGLGAGLVLILTQSLGLPHKYLSFISVVAVVLILWVVRRIRNSYVDAFRQALEGQKIDLSQLRTNLAEASALQTVLPYLKSDNARQVVYVLELISSVPVKSKALSQPLEELFSHHSEKVRQKALEFRSHQEPALKEEQLEQLLQDPDEGVRALALRLRSLLDEDSGQARIEAELSSQDTQRIASALEALSGLPKETRETILTEERIRSFEDPVCQHEEVLAALANVLAFAENDQLDHILDQLLSNPSYRVIRAGIDGLGESRNARYLPWLVRQLAQPQRRSAARKALVSYGNQAVDVLVETLHDRKEDLSIRRTIPRVLGSIPSQASVDGLLQLLDAQDPAVYRNVLQALSKLRNSYDELHFDKKLVSEAVLVELGSYFANIQVLSLMPNTPEGDAEKLLYRSLNEKQLQRRHNIFLLLGLRYDPSDMMNAYYGITSQKAELRASALEFLDNVLRKPLRDPVLLVFDEISEQERIEKGQSLFFESIDTNNQAYCHLLDGRDAWLKACALYAGACSDEFATQVEAARQDLNPVVRETAERVYAQTRPTR